MKCAGDDAADVPSDKEEEDAVLLRHISSYLQNTAAHCPYYNHFYHRYHTSTAAPNAKTSLCLSVLLLMLFSLHFSAPPLVLLVWPLVLLLPYYGLWHILLLLPFLLLKLQSILQFLSAAPTSIPTSIPTAPSIISTTAPPTCPRTISTGTEPTLYRSPCSCCYDC